MEPDSQFFFYAKWFFLHCVLISYKSPEIAIALVEKYPGLQEVQIYCFVTIKNTDETIK